MEFVAPMRGPMISTSHTEPSTKTPIMTTESAPSCASSAALYSVPSKMTPVFRKKRAVRTPFAAHAGILNTLTITMPRTMPSTT